MLTNWHFLVARQNRQPAFVEMAGYQVREQLDAGLIHRNKGFV